MKSYRVGGIKTKRAPAFNVFEILTSLTRMEETRTVENVSSLRIPSPERHRFSVWEFIV